MKHGVAVALVACVLTLAACSDDAEPLPPRAEATATAAPAYDGTLEPAAAVLALVPEAAYRVSVTDYDEVREELGLEPATDEAMAREFWARAEAERPLLDAGLLRPDPVAARASWEAHFFDEGGAELGYVVAFPEDVDLDAVAALPQAAGGQVDRERGLLTRGTTDDPEQSWAADPQWTAMVGLPANATYLSRGCVADQGGVDLDELDGYAVAFEGTLVTARLGADRQDLFIRMRMAGDDPGFAQDFTGGVADPRSGRIGYRMTDPARAARDALEGRLPFAACS